MSDVSRTLSTVECEHSLEGILFKLLEVGFGLLFCYDHFFELATRYKK
jgi:hypothetical protein